VADDQQRQMVCLAHSLFVPCGLCKLRGPQPETYTDDPAQVEGVRRYVEMRSRIQ